MERARWTTPAELRVQLDRRWKKGEFLAEHVAWAPLRVALRVPDAKALRDEFETVRTWIRELESSNRAALGYGYDIVWTEINHRQLGKNRLPKAVVFEHRKDVLTWLRVEKQARCFALIERATLDAFPELASWLLQRPFGALEHEQVWSRVLKVLGWMREHPQPGLYLRQLEIPGVDTKFIETYKPLLAELLELVLPASVIHAEAHPVRQFELRYGLKVKPPLVRFRCLDPAVQLGPLDDISIPAAQLAQLRLPIRNVFVTENETNGLAFPQHAGSIVLFGLGYGLNRLSELPWLHETSVYYWGDLDTHGFAMLDRLRVHLPHARSFLMDRQTLELHRELWSVEASPYLGELPRLTPDEATLYDDLKSQRLGTGVRLEQERIAYAWLRQALLALVS